MCWSAVASLNTYLLALFGAAIALANGCVPVAFVVFLMAFSNVQLVECLIWNDMDRNRAANNRVLSMLLAVVLLLEPVASIFLIPEGAARGLWLAAYAAFVVLALCVAFGSGTANGLRWSTTVAANGHLGWDWLPDAGLFAAVALLVWATFLLAPLLIAGYRRSFAFGVLALVVSVACFYRGGTVATMWCWFAAFAWVAVIAQCLLPRIPEALMCAPSR